MYFSLAPLQHTSSYGNCCYSLAPIFNLHSLFIRLHGLPGLHFCVQRFTMPFWSGTQDKILTLYSGILRSLISNLGPFLSFTSNILFAFYAPAIQSRCDSLTMAGFPLPLGLCTFHFLYLEYLFYPSGVSSSITLPPPARHRYIFPLRFYCIFTDFT